MRRDRRGRGVPLLRIALLWFVSVARGSSSVLLPCNTIGVEVLYTTEVKYRYNRGMRAAPVVGKKFSSLHKQSTQSISSKSITACIMPSMRLR